MSGRCVTCQAVTDAGKPTTCPDCPCRQNGAPDDAPGRYWADVTPEGVPVVRSSEDDADVALATVGSVEDAMMIADSLNVCDGATEALQKIERLRRKWEATRTGDREPWAAVGSEAHKIASDFLRGQS